MTELISTEFTRGFPARFQPCFNVELNSVNTLPVKNSLSPLDFT